MRNAVRIKTYALPPVNEREALRYAGCRGEADEALLSLLQECVRESESAFSPRVCFATFPTAVLLQAFGESELVKLRLKDTQSAVVFAATVGLEIDRLILRYESVSPAKALVLQALGAERIESLCDTFCAEFSNARPRFSPGYGDLPVQAQEWFFKVLNIPKNIGVTLNSSLLMTPTKSVTAILPLK